MTDEVFEAKLQALCADIELLPEPQRSRMRKMVEETRHRHQTIKEASRRSRELLDDWRIAAKYALFDLEARRREANEQDDEDRTC